MAQLNKVETDTGFGCCDYFGCGKYKALQFPTVYEIANQGDFKYLSWIINCNAFNAKKERRGESVFKIHPTVIPHAQAAMRIAGTDKKWEHTFTKDENDPTIWRKQYRTTDGSLEGPIILYRTCSLCQKRKNYIRCLEVGKGKSVCTNCYKEYFEKA